MKKKYINWYSIIFRINELITAYPPREIFAEAANYFGKVVALVKDVDLKGQEGSKFSANLLAIQQVAKKNMIVANLMATQKMTVWVWERGLRTF